ncbi:hypothetical protein AMTRI_Chr10g227260 [Amborella trichopoda]|uniref:Uncharacterized protein ycf33 n=1 Tax=Amborella trichopoda TaxID=13333 RepID=W1PR90_AMBTC|nr:uncharacterized protein LOC18438747 [Amborella trichopoda]ERN10573.1 hypothetical protein AMTR_s00028p00084470 [Amborella trichopoda]|eukprot:XP_006848992.1 uncharacterized protein LOC18438747 [Amborella trichopoda]
MISTSCRPAPCVGPTAKSLSPIATKACFKPRKQTNFPNLAKITRFHFTKLTIEDTQNGKLRSHESPLFFSNGLSKGAILGAFSIGLAMFMLGFDEKALALGPEGPLLEEFWDNMRRYGLYILTVSTGVIYTVFRPIIGLLKSPLSAILIIIIFGGTLFLVMQVLNAMFGISEFAYDYGY